MRLFFLGALCIITVSTQANVIQYFSGISYNNASELFKTKKYQFILGGTETYADLKFSGSALNFNTFRYDSGVNNSRTLTFMPYGRIAKRLNKKAVFAVDLTEPFNSNLDWGNDTFTRYAVTQNYLRNIDISPKLSYALSKKIQIGGGINLNFIKRNEVNWAYPTGPNSSAILKNPTSSFGVGYNLGVTYLWNKKNIWGLTYYSQIKQNTQGTSTLGYLRNPNLSFSFYLPETTIASYLHIFNNSWLVNFQFFQSNWNINQYVRLYNTAVPPPRENFVFDMHFDPSYAYMLALRHQLHKKLGLALVGFKDDGPEQKYLRTLVFPSAIQYLIGFAADYHYNKKTTFELLYGHVFSFPSIQNSVNVNNVMIPFTTGSVNINADVFDLRVKVEM